jgi:ribosomal-protein-alanine N-acetyltransferase
MLEELQSNYGVGTFVAVLKAANFRSLGLLGRLGFVAASTRQVAEHGAEPDELVMVKQSTKAQNGA